MSAFSEGDMELGSSLPDLGSARIVLLPVGNISTERFDHLASLVEEIKQLPLKALPRRMTEEQLSSDGNVLSRSSGLLDTQDNAEDGEAAVSIRYERLRRAPSGEVLLPQPSEWEAFRASLRIWGAIGIFELNDDAAIDSEKEAVKLFADARRDFASIVSQSRSLSTARCIVFTTPEAVGKPGAKIFLSSLYNPVEGESIDGNATISFGVVPYSPESTEFEVQMEIRAQVLHIADLILQALDKSLRIQKQTTGPILSPLDMKHSVDKQSVLRQRRQGRLEKCLGDLYLLLANPGLAKAKYESAIEKTKTNTDRLWLASSLEGYNAASATTTDQETIDSILKKGSEALKLYRKKRLFELEVSAAMKMATYLSTFPDRRHEALEYAQLAAQAGDFLRPARKKMALLSQLVRLMTTIGAFRKAALFLYQLGSLYFTARKWRESYDVSLEIGKVLTLAETFGLDSKICGSTWATLRRSLFVEAAEAASKMSDEERRSFCFINALSLSRNVISVIGDDDREIVQHLNRLNEPISVIESNQLESVMSFVSVETSRHSSQIRDLAQVEKAAQNSGPFIFSSLQGDVSSCENSVSFWIQNEPILVPVTFQSYLRTNLDVRYVAFLVRESSGSPNAKPETSGEKTLKQEIAESVRLVSTQPKVVKFRGTGKFDVPTTSSTVLQCTPITVGTFQIVGLAGVLFGSCLARFPLSSKCGEAGVQVLPNLSTLEIKFLVLKNDRAVEVDELTSSAHILNGEARGLRVNLRNSGDESIVNVSVQLVYSEMAMRLFKFDEQVKKLHIDNLAAAECTSLEVPFGFADILEGTGTVECTAEHSAENCGRIFRETKKQVTIRTQSAIILKNTELLYLTNGEIGAIVDIENTSSMFLTIKAYQWWNDTEETPEVFSEFQLDPCGEGSAVVKLRQGSTLDNVKIAISWESVIRGGHGLLVFPLSGNDSCVGAESAGFLAQVPKVRLDMSINKKFESDVFLDLSAGVFHDIFFRGKWERVDDSEELHGLIDLRICQENGYGGRKWIAGEEKVLLVGANEKIPMNSTTKDFEHRFKIRFSYAGEYGLEARARFQSEQITRFWRMVVKCEYSRRQMCVY